MASESHLLWNSVLSLGPIATQSISDRDTPQDLSLQQATSKCHKLVWKLSDKKKT